MNKNIDKLLKNHQKLIHSEGLKVESHIQRIDDEWYVNTLMLENITVPFKYKRKQPYKSLTGQRINITYYPNTEVIAGLEFETMKVVRLKTY